MLRFLLIGLVLDVIGDRALTSNGIHLLAKAALDLSALPRRNVGVKQHVNLFESLAIGLWIGEENVKRHGGAKHRENNVRPPLDVGKGRSDEVGKRKVEDPVCSG